MKYILKVSVSLDVHLQNESLLNFLSRGPNCRVKFSQAKKKKQSKMKQIKSLDINTYIYFSCCWKGIIFIVDPKRLKDFARLLY